MRKHVFGRWNTRSAAACDVPGVQERVCRHCGVERQTRETKPLKHRAAKWTVSKAAKLFEAGEQVKLCRRCGVVLQRRSFTLPKSRFAVSFCSFGLPLRELLPGQSDKWYMLTPVDLTREGLQRYPIIANGSHIIGEVSLLIRDGTLTLSNTLYDSRSEVLKPSVRFFRSLDGLTEKDVEARRNQLKYDQPISIARTFKDASIVLMSLRCDGIYDDAAPGNVLFDEDAPLLPGADVTYHLALEEMRLLVKRLQEEKHD